jgi:hypothetical protein
MSLVKAFCSAETCFIKIILYQKFLFVIQCSNLPQLYARFNGVHLRELKHTHSTVSAENRIHVDGNLFGHKDL